MRIERIGDATLYLGDCLEILQTLGKVDAVVTDPPYGINYKRDSRKTYGFHALRPNSSSKYIGGKAEAPIIGDDKPFDPTPFLIAEAHIFWGANNYADKLPAKYGWLVWDKQITETWRASACELAWTDFLGSVRCFRHRWQGMMRDGKECPYVGGKLVHPTQKPEALMDWCLSFLPKAETILDPFMGSGTTGVACANLGRKFIGIEIEEKYFDIACERITAAYAQGRLFD